jgi:hypothetical protein
MPKDQKSKKTLGLDRGLELDREEIARMRRENARSARDLIDFIHAGGHKPVPDDVIRRLRGA